MILGQNRSPNAPRSKSAVTTATTADPGKLPRHASVRISSLPIALLGQAPRQFWGEPYGRLKDPFGHEWTIAQMLDALDSDEVENAARAHLTRGEQ